MLRTEKYCGSCRAVKPRTEFNKRAASNDGLAYSCRSCTKKYQQQHRAKYPKTDTQLQAIRNYSRTYRESNKAEINARRKAVRAEQRRIEAIRMKFYYVEGHVDV